MLIKIADVYLTCLSDEPVTRSRRWSWYQLLFSHFQLIIGLQERRGFLPPPLTHLCPVHWERTAVVLTGALL